MSSYICCNYKTFLVYLSLELLFQVIVPQYFYQCNDKSATQNPIAYIKKNCGNNVIKLTVEELQCEAANMIKLRKDCSAMAYDDLSLYTIRMASMLDIKHKVLDMEAPVLDRKDWMKSLSENPSNLQVQKFIFAWFFARTNYKKLVSELMEPDENFEKKFMRKHGLVYDTDCIAKMKKNSKTCIRLLYNVRARAWREKMLDHIRNQLHLSVSVTAPRELRDSMRNYRREPNTFFLGNHMNKEIKWSIVS